MKSFFSIRAGDLVPVVRGTLANVDAQTADGVTTPQDLTGCSVFFIYSKVGEVGISRAATITNPLAGEVEYAWQEGETDDDGEYQFRWKVIFPTGEPMSFSNRELQYFTIIPKEIVSNLGDFRPCIQLWMGDLDPTFRRYSNDTLDTAVKAVVRMGRVPGYTVSGNSILPGVTNPNHFALVVFRVCEALIAHTPDSYQFRTRALSERFGSQFDFINTIAMEIHKLINGSMFGAWQTFYDWQMGMAGLNLAAVMTEMNVSAPFYSASLSVGGLYMGSRFTVSGASGA